MGPSQLTTLPVKSLHHSSHNSNSFPTTIWSSWGFNLYSQWGFHSHRQMRSLPYTIPVTTTTTDLLHHQKRCKMLSEKLNDWKARTCGKCKKKNQPKTANWNELLAKPERFLSSINDGNCYIHLLCDPHIGRGSSSKFALSHPDWWVYSWCGQGKCHYTKAQLIL